jgi:hypothetical protein
MEDKLVTVADFTDHIAANAAKLQLEAEGIEAVVVGENLMGAYPTYGTMQIEVQVMEKDAAKARAVLGAGDEQSEQTDQESE